MWVELMCYGVYLLHICLFLTYVNNCVSNIITHMHALHCRDFMNWEQEEFW